jgi:hypothetical protein
VDDVVMLMMIFYDLMEHHKLWLERHNLSRVHHNLLEARHMMVLVVDHKQVSI